MFIFLSQHLSFQAVTTSSSLQLVYLQVNIADQFNFWQFLYFVLLARAILGHATLATLPPSPPGCAPHSCTGAHASLQPTHPGSTAQRCKACWHKQKKIYTIFSDSACAVALPPPWLEPPSPPFLPCHPAPPPPSPRTTTGRAAPTPLLFLLLPP